MKKALCKSILLCLLVLPSHTNAHLISFIIGPISIAAGLTFMALGCRCCNHNISNGYVILDDEIEIPRESFSESFRTRFELLTHDPGCVPGTALCIIGLNLLAMGILAFTLDKYAQ